MMEATDYIRQLEDRIEYDTKVISSLQERIAELEDCVGRLKGKIDTAAKALNYHRADIGQYEKEED